MELLPGMNLGELVLQTGHFLLHAWCIFFRKRAVHSMKHTKWG